MDFKDGRLSGARFMVYCLAWSFGKFSRRVSVFLFLLSITFASVLHSGYYLGNVS